MKELDYKKILHKASIGFACFEKIFEDSESVKIVLKESNELFFKILGLDIDCDYEKEINTYNWGELFFELKDGGIYSSKKLNKCYKITIDYQDDELITVIFNEITSPTFFTEGEYKNFNEHLSYLLENLQIGIVIIDRKTKIIEGINKYATELIGETRENIIGKVCNNFICPSLENECPVCDKNLSIEKSERILLTKDRKEIPIIKSVKEVIINGEAKNLESFIDISELIEIRKALQESELKYRELSEQFEAILDHLPALVFYKDRFNKFIRVNKYVAQAYGLAKEQLENKDLYEFYPKELADKYYQDDLVVINSGIPKLNYEEPWLTDSGLRWVSTSKVPFRDIKTNEIIGIIGISLDITDRKMVEQELLKERNMLETILDSLPVAVNVKDIYGKKTLVNIKEVDLIGKSFKKDIIGKTDFELYPKHIAEKSYKEDKFVIDKGQPLYNIESSYIDKDGNERWLLGTKVPLYNNDGNIIGIIGINYDITEKKIAENLLKEERYRLEMIIKGTNAGTWEWNIVTGELKINSRWAEIIGYTIEELEPLSIQTWFKLCHPDDLIKSNELLQQHFNMEIEYYECEVRMQHKNGNWVWVLDHGMVYKWSGDNKPLLMSGTHIDITKRKQDEEQIHKKNLELTKAIKEKDKFFSIIAHDLKAPFNGFLGLTELLANELHRMPIYKIQNFIVLLEKTAKNLYSLLENLLQWAQVQRGSLTLNKTIIKLDEVVEECLQVYRELAKTKEIFLRNSVPENFVVFTDKEIVSTVLRNLISNSIKFTNRNGEVEIRAKSYQNGDVEVMVRDTGIGMSEDFIEGLFKLDVNTKRRGTENEPSTGLGLILCKDLIEFQKGRLWVESKEGKGSNFYFTLVQE